MDRSPKTSSFLCVVAIDIGTTYSGFAFSFIDDPFSISCQKWVAGTGRLMSEKTATSILLSPHGEFSAFGFEAEDHYTSLLQDDKHAGWMLYSRFKMMLFENKELSNKTMITDSNGQEFNAMKIFSMAIKYLKTQMLEEIQKQKAGMSEKDIMYVITVPAIWDEKAKQFMREAAQQAGICGERLVLALEPEAASIFCSKTDTDIQMACAGTGTRRMVIDLGGGTADISVHERKPDGTLREIHKASGGPWGGIYVDQSFFEWLKGIFGEQAVQETCSDYEEYLDMQREFETKKRAFRFDSKSLITFKIPSKLRDLSEKYAGKSLSSLINGKGLGEKVVLAGKDKLRMNPSVLKSCMDVPLKSLFEHVRQLFLEPTMRSVNTVILVGGFGESNYVYERMKKEFPDKQIKTPNEAGLVVLKGAVLFGHLPRLVTSRVVKSTFGIALDQMYHDKLSIQRTTVVGKEKVTMGCFKIFVEAETEMDVDAEVSHEFTANGPEWSLLEVFLSTKQNPLYVDEAGCSKLGNLVVHHPGRGKKENKKIVVTFLFGKTELMVKYRIKETGKEEYLKIDCLT